MRSHVNLEAFTIAERFLTFLARERPLAGVDQFMAAEVALGGESLRAVPTDERALSGVRAHVS